MSTDNDPDDHDVRDESMSKTTRRGLLGALGVAGLASLGSSGASANLGGGPEAGAMTDYQVPYFRVPESDLDTPGVVGRRVEITAGGSTYSAGDQLVDLGDRWELVSPNYGSVSTESVSITDQFSLSRSGANPYLSRSFERAGPPQFQDAAGISNPVLDASDSVDSSCVGLADPFFIEDSGTLYLFAEMLGDTLDIELFTGSNVSNLTSEGIIGDGNIQSFPHVFKTPEDGWIMTPTVQSDNIVAYQTDELTSWPTSPTETLIDTSRTLSDPCPVYIDSQNRWYIILVDDTDGGSGNFQTRLYYADQGKSVLGRSWTEHPSSPIHEESTEPEATKIGGRPIHYGDGIIDVFYQSYREDAGNVSAFRIDDVTTSTFNDFELPTSPVYQARRGGWNAKITHHVDFMLPNAGGSPIGVVDGQPPNAAPSEWDIGVVTPARTTPSFARLKPTSDQTGISSGTITLDTVSSGYFRYTDLSSSEYIARENGRYEVSAQLKLDNIPSSGRFIIFLRDSSSANLAISRHEIATTEQQTVDLAPRKIDLTEGQRIHLEIFSSSSLDVLASDETYLEAERVE